MSGGKRLSLFEARDVSNEATSVVAWPAISWGQPSGGQWNIANRPSRITSDAPGCCPFGRLPGSQQRALHSWRPTSLFVEGAHGEVSGLRGSPLGQHPRPMGLHA